MIEIACQTCGEKAGVHSFLAAAQQTCGRCGNLLMGTLSSGNRTYRAADLGGGAPAPAWAAGTASPAGRWLGVVVGIAAGVGLVAGVGCLGNAIPLPVRGAIVLGLSGVLLSPVLFFFTFFIALFSMFIPFSVDGIVGDAIWNRLAQANNEGSLVPLILPFLLLVAAPVALCALGGTRVKSIPTPMLISAGLGAVLLGALVGGVCGGIFGRRRQQV